MFVVELFLPLEKPDGSAVPTQVFERIKTELTTRFGGVTAHLRASSAAEIPGCSSSTKRAAYCGTVRPAGFTAAALADCSSCSTRLR